MKYLIYIITAAFIFSCSPVRNSYQVKEGDEQTVISDTSENEEVYTGAVNEVTDTTYIELPPIYIEQDTTVKGREINLELDSAVNLFNDGEYNKACNKLSILQETLKEQDSLYFEAIFYNSECLIIKNKYQMAEELLVDLLNEDLYNSIKQRVWLRLGHIECAKGNERKAGSYFRKIKGNFSNSIYLEIANCSSLE